MREAGAVWPFVFAADMVEHIRGDDGHGVVFVEDDVEAVGQVVFDELDRFQHDAVSRLVFCPRRKRSGGENGDGEKCSEGHGSGMRQAER